METLPQASQPTAMMALLCLMLSLDGLLSVPAMAQFTSPPGQGAPKSTAAGGSRPPTSLCFQPESSERPMLLAPTKFVGLTSATTPTFWVYLPKTIARTLEFTLTSDAEEIYQTNLPISSTGLVAIQLPATIKLKTDKPYSWVISLVCNPTERSHDWVVEGSMQHQLPNVALQQQLTQSSPSQTVKLYLQSGFWYEGLNAYLRLRQHQPTHTDLASLWKELLDSAGLPAIAPPPLTVVAQ